MTGIKALQKIQLGVESIAGTLVAADVIWRGTGVPADDIEIIRPDENIGVAAPTDRTYVSKYGSTWQFEDTPATFQHLNYVLSCGVENDEAGVADGAGTGKIFTHNLPGAAASTIVTATLEGGDNQQEEESGYAFVESFNISGKGGEALMMNSTWRAHQLQPGTFTAGLAVVPVEEVLFSRGIIYIEPTGGTFSSTRKVGTLMSMNLQCNTGWAPYYSADGGMNFAFHKWTRENFNLAVDMTFEHNASAVAEKLAWRAGTARMVSLVFGGSALTTPGTAYSYFTFKINLVGKWDSFSAITDENGNDQVTGKFLAAYNATEAELGHFVVVNETATRV